MRVRVCSSMGDGNHVMSYRCHVIQPLMRSVSSSSRIGVACVTWPRVHGRDAPQRYRTLQTNHCCLYSDMSMDLPSYMISAWDSSGCAVTVRCCWALEVLRVNFGLWGCWSCMDQHGVFLRCVHAWIDHGFWQQRIPCWMRCWTHTMLNDAFAFVGEGKFDAF